MKCAMCGREIKGRDCIRVNVPNVNVQIPVGAKTINISSQL